MALFVSHKKPSFLKQLIGLGLLLFIVFMIPITIAQSQRVQQTQSKAAGYADTITTIGGLTPAGAGGGGSAGQTEPGGAPSTPQAGTTRPHGWTTPCPTTGTTEETMTMLERCSNTYENNRARFCVRPITCPEPAVESGETPTPNPTGCYEIVASTITQWPGWRGRDGTTCTIALGGQNCVGCTQFGDYWGIPVTNVTTISGVEPSSGGIGGGGTGNTITPHGGAGGGNTGWQEMLRNFLDESNGVSFSQIQGMMQQYLHK